MSSSCTPAVARDADHSFSRRTVLAAGLALPLAACGREPAASQPVVATPLKALAPFPIGVAVNARQLEDPAAAALVTTHFSQITADWQMKMEQIVQPDGSFRFDDADIIAAFARQNSLRLFGHTLVWYADIPAAFKQLDENRQSFEAAVRNYIAAVAGRYRGQAVAWDVINEPIKDDGSGPRDSLWSQRLGQTGHFHVAYGAARAADPDALLFTNDYHLESKPAKLASYMRLIEQLLREGVPLDGIGCQTHVDADLPAGAITRTLKTLATLGLPIHLSEMDVSVVQGGLLSSRQQAEQAQARLYGEAMDAFAALPERQQFAFTVWGLRDRDSWLKRENKADAPLLFDDAGRPKPAFAAVEQALRR